MTKDKRKLTAYHTKKVIEIPLTVVTLTNVPKSLRGDLSKWMQEIATGVYVGNFNSKVRDQLWARILENIGDGQATISYAYRNEIGYKFDTANTQREAIDCEGLPLVLIKKEDNDIEYKKGYSKAAKFRKAKKFSQNNIDTKLHIEEPHNYIVLDIETDGLDFKKNNIIEIGAVKISEREIQTFQSLINTGVDIPRPIEKLTKINREMLEEEGRDLEEVLEEFLEFIEDSPLVGYNLNFDIMFINMALKQLGKNQVTNKKYDLLSYIKKENKYLSSYKLSNVLKQYNITKEPPHRALEDAKLTYELSKKVDKLLEDLNNK